MSTEQSSGDQNVTPGKGRNMLLPLLESLFLAREDGARAFQRSLRAFRNKREGRGSKLAPITCS